MDLENNNLRCPVDNLLGKFKTYVNTKNTFDPAPRLFQEARWLGKEIIYLRDEKGYRIVPKDKNHLLYKSKTTINNRFIPILLKNIFIII